jgi:hypothetical protein
LDPLFFDLIPKLCAFGFKRSAFSQKIDPDSNCRIYCAQKTTEDKNVFCAMMPKNVTGYVKQ